MQIEVDSIYRYRKTMQSIGFTLLIFLAFINLFGLLAGGLEELLLLLEVDKVTSEVGYQLFYGAGYLAAFMLPVIFLKKMLRKAGFANQPMRTSPGLSPWLPLILFAGIAVILATAYLNATMVSIFSFFDFGKTFPQSTGNEPWYSVVLTFLVLCLVPAVCEEFLFRGAILTNLLPFGRANAILVSALLFGLMHQNFAQFFYAFCAGIVLGLVYERTGSIWNCIFLHLVNNTYSIFEEQLEKAFGNLFSPLALSVLELSIFAIGMVSAVILILRFAPRRQSFSEGIFEKEVPVSDSYSIVQIPVKTRIKSFFNVPMIIFLILAVLEALVVVFLLPFFS